MHGVVFIHEKYGGSESKRAGWRGGEGHGERARGECTGGKG